MNISRIILNKLLLPLTPLVLITLAGFVFADEAHKAWLNKWSLWILLVVGLLFFFTNNLSGHIRAYQARKKKFSNPDLNNPTSNLEAPSKLNILDKRLSISKKSIDVLLNNKVIVHLNREKQEIEIVKPLGKRTLKFSEISYLIVDNNVYDRESLLETFFNGEGVEAMFEKSVMTNTFSAILKNGKEQTLFKSKLFQKSYTHDDDFESSKRTLEKTCYENGKKVISILSHFMDFKYMVLDNRI